MYSNVYVRMLKELLFLLTLEYSTLSYYSLLEERRYHGRHSVTAHREDSPRWSGTRGSTVGRVSSCASTAATDTHRERRPTSISGSFSKTRTRKIRRKVPCLATRSLLSTTLCYCTALPAIFLVSLMKPEGKLFTQ